MDWKKDTVTLQNSVKTRNDELMVVRTWTNEKTLQCVMMPYNPELAQKEYGITDDIAYRLIMKEKEFSIEVGKRVLFDNKALYVVFVPYIPETTLWTVALLNVDKTYKNSL